MTSPEDVEEVSLEESLRSALAAATEAEEVPEAKPKEEPEAEEPEPQSARERDEHGRFKSKEEAPVEAGEGEVQEEVKPDPYGLAPQYSKGAIRDNWEKLPPEVRKDIVEREREIHQQFTRYDEERNFGKQVKGIVAPYEQLIRSLGAEPVQALDYLLKTDYALRTANPEQRKQMFLKAASDYGISFDGEQPQHQPIDPTIETALQRIARLESELNSASIARKESEEAEIAQSIEAFASDPEHVYFEQVRPVMSALLQSGQAGSLKEAYDQAVWADPQTRALHLEAQRQTEERKRTAAQAEQARAARRASPSVTGAPGLAVPPQMNGSSNSVEDDIRAAISAVSGRA